MVEPIELVAKVSDQVSVRMFYDGQQDVIHCQWSPDVPTELTHEELSRYQAARTRFLGQVAQAMGVDNVTTLD